MRAIRLLCTEFLILFSTIQDYVCFFRADSLPTASLSIVLLLRLQYPEFTHIWDILPRTMIAEYHSISHYYHETKYFQEILSRFFEL